MAGETVITVRSDPQFEALFDRMRAAPNQVVEHLPGPNPQVRLDRRRATVNGTRKTFPARREVNQHPAPEFAEAVTISRFWRNVRTGADDECWPWTGDTRDGGYGVFYFDGRIVGAHELALSFTSGEARHPDLMTCHSCDNPSCCNPHHLRFDTAQSNVDDMNARGRAARQGRLTDEQVVTIRQRRASGARQEDLAADFGVSSSLISMIVRGKRWSEVPGPVEAARNQYRRA